MKSTTGGGISKRIVAMRGLLALYGFTAAMCLVSAFPGRQATPLTSRRRHKRRRNPDSFRTFKGELGAGVEKQSQSLETSTSSPLPLPSTDNDDNDERNEYADDDESFQNDDDNDGNEYAVTSPKNTHDDVVTSLLTNDAFAASSADVSSSSSPPAVVSTSASRWKRRKQIAAGLVASIAATAGAAKTGMLGAPYTDGMIARDVFMTGLTGVLAVIMNRSITWGYESGVYDSKTGRKITHILSAPLFIVTWPFFSEAGGARVFAGLVTLTNMYRLYLAGTGDAAESSLVNTISRSGDKSECLGGPFIYVCLFQVFLLAFWRDSFPGVVAMTTMAAGDGMADIVGRRYGRNGYKWPFGDGQKSLAGTVAFAVFAFGLTLAVTSWLITTGSLTSTLTLSSRALRVLAISCICALVEVLPVGDDNYTVPGSAALLSALWLH